MTAPTIEADDDLPLTVPALLRARVGARGDVDLLVRDDERLTYADADARSADLARGLVALGAGPGTHVGILHPDGADFVVAWLAAARIGAVSVPLSTFSTPVELAGLLRSADVALLLSANAHRSHDYVASLTAAVPGLDPSSPPPVRATAAPVLRHVLFRDAAPGVAATATVAHALERGRHGDPAVLPALEDGVRPADRMVIVHTSGSTSAPKGVVHTHGALIRHLDNLNQLRRLEPPEVLFSTAPFFWIGGFAYALLGTLVAGTTLVRSNAADAGAVLDVLERERPTMVNGFAASVAHLPEHPSFPSRDLSSIRRGNLHPILPPDVRPRDPGLHHAMLGMTETGSVCLASDDEGEQPEARRGSFGRPVPGFEARVVSPDDGTECGTGAVGELWLRGPFLMEGYHGHERHEVFEPDGWFRTGDLVTVDVDGFFHFEGRAGDLIKTAGASVSPREVEDAIRDACGLTAHVLGLDDDVRGQIVAAAVRVPAGRQVDLAELRDRLAERLSAYKRPRRIVLVADDDVPLLSSGKPDTRALGELLSRGR